MEYNAELRKKINTLILLGRLRGTTTILVAGEAWSDQAIADIQSWPDDVQMAWGQLLPLASQAGGGQPTPKWLNQITPFLEEVGFPAFRQTILKWFPLVDKPRTIPITEWSQWDPDPNNLLDDTNGDVLKGLAWLCAGAEDKDTARALADLARSAYRKAPGVGPRCPRVGNACVWALGQMAGREGIGQLALLQVRVKFKPAQKSIEKALTTAAEREGLPRDEINELAVPTYGLTEVGMRGEQLGSFTAVLQVTGTTSVTLVWRKPDGKTQKSVPKLVKTEYAAQLADLKQAVKDIRKMLPAQRDRIENLYLARKMWSYPTWRERYLDHPLIGTLARRIIWFFQNDTNQAAAMWHDGQLVTHEGRPISWLDDDTQVSLWHPIDQSTATIQAWRAWLEKRQIQQPFKQAHREIYRLTDAERQTQVYSNRFAAHIIRQHPFHALCETRGWNDCLYMMMDEDDRQPAERKMPAWNLLAEFWADGIGEQYGVDTNESGAYLYLTTDQVRFYTLPTVENNATSSETPLSLAEIPPLVFSEILRDVDLFVGVCSVGNDPNWSDGGPGGHYRDYWQDYSFSETLSEIAKIRRQVLEGLVPKLKIADKCHLDGRYLIVQGGWHTYKIHLGSGNILMSPDDQYLCIVPARGAAQKGAAGQVFLPFEGDRMLGLILSKAFLLANDTQITDRSILRQIK